VAFVWDPRELQTFLMVFLWWICGEMRGGRGEKMTVNLTAKIRQVLRYFLSNFDGRNLV
jgi:hypothetical protein